MVLDSSAVVAILLRQPGYDVLLERLSEADSVGISAPTMVEAAIVLSARLGRDARPLLQEFLNQAGAVVIPFSEDHFFAAVDAFLLYGKGRHPAALNFGDCLSYAAATVAGVPLLYLGDDFAKTDLADAGTGDLQPLPALKLMPVAEP